MKRKSIPPLIRLFVVHTLLGYVVAAVFVVLLYAFNVANLWDLVSRSDVPVLATFLLWFFNGIVFSGAQVGIAVMNLAEPPDDRSGGRHAGFPMAVPLRLRAARPSRGRQNR